VSECLDCDAAGAMPEPLLRPVIAHGELVETLPSAAQARARASAAIAKLPSPVRSLYDEKHPYPVDYSAKLRSLYDDFLMERRQAQP
jgi:hypothetical protein